MLQAARAKGGTVSHGGAFAHVAHATLSIIGASPTCAPSGMFTDLLRSRSMCVVLRNTVGCDCCEASQRDAEGGLLIRDTAEARGC